MRLVAIGLRFTLIAYVPSAPAPNVASFVSAHGPLTQLFAVVSHVPLPSWAPINPRFASQTSAAPDAEGAGKLAAPIARRIAMERRRGKGRWEKEGVMEKTGVFKS